MILVIPSILLPVASTYVFYERHWKSVARNMISSFTGEVVMVTEHMKSQYNRSESSQYIRDLERNLGFNVRFTNGIIKEPINKSVEATLVPLMEQLKIRLAVPFRLYYENTNKDMIWIDIQIDDYAIMSIGTTTKRISNPTTYIYVLFMGVTAFILFFIAAIFTRNQIRSISKLSEAMSSYGTKMSVGNYKPSGAKEVRLAGENFLKMRHSIKKHMDQRTQMLAAISHDLRTPLTRMHLALAMLEKGNHVEDLKRDIEEMQHMINEYLAFAKGEGGEQKQSVIMADFIDNIVSRYKNYGSNITYACRYQGALMLKERALTRCILNLIDNALRYGEAAHVELSGDAHHCMIAIDDNGPGIPVEERDKIFTPFYRVDSSRNQNMAGVGLGMAITKDIVSSHGGTIALQESVMMGGLRVIIQLPA